MHSTRLLHSPIEQFLSYGQYFIGAESIGQCFHVYLRYNLQLDKMQVQGKISQHVIGENKSVKTVLKLRLLGIKKKCALL